MKEATGDMTMTIVVIVGIVAVLTLGTTVIWPAIQQKITGEIDKVGNAPYVEVVEEYNI